MSAIENTYVRLDEARDDYYNAFIGCKIHGKHLPADLKKEPTRKAEPWHNRS